MNHMQLCVEDFHRKFGGRFGSRWIPMPEDVKVRRISLIMEEAAEFAAACRKSNQVEMIDAICDLLYVTFGTAVEMGIDIAPFFDEVHRSNMTKTGGSQDSGGKILKGPNYEPPLLQKILEEQA